jgi:hypothetical protein
MSTLMRRSSGLHIIICLVVIAALWRPVAANCQVNGAVGVNGTAGNDTIVCDNNPAVPVNQNLIGGGSAGNDTIIINSNNQTLIAGDGVTSPFSLSSAGVAGSDSITINGVTAADVYGDYLSGGVNAAGDAITINGQARTIYGDYAGGTANGGNDTIIINGTVTNAVNGDTQWIATAGNVFRGGDDTITVNGTVGSINGDSLLTQGTRIGGADTIIINGTAIVNGSITGETNASVGGNDTVTISTGATINGTISGGNAAGDFDTLTFTGSTTDAAGYTQVQALVGCNPCSGTVTIGGKTYNFINFEQLVNLMTLIAIPANTPVVIMLDNQPAKPPINDMTLICSDSNVMVYRLKTGEIEFYFINAPQHFLVAQVTHGALTAGQRTFAAASHTNPGWRVEISDGYFGQVFDSSNNPVGLTCQFTF